MSPEASEDTVTRTVVVGLTVPVSSITPTAPLTGLALTKEGVLVLCTNDTGLAVDLGVEELRWLSRMTATYADRLDMEARSAQRIGRVAGNA